MTTSPPAAPRVLGRLANRILIWGLVLSVVATVLLMVQDSDAFLEGLLAVAGFGLLLTGLPAALFLIYSRRDPPPEVPRATWTAIYFSAVVLVLFGALMALGPGGGAGVAIGVVLAAVGVTTIIGALRFPTAAPGETRLAYGRSSVVGAFLFLLVVVMVPKFACGCGGKGKAYLALLKSDLRNLVTAEEAFFADHHRFGLMRDLVRDNAFYTSSGDSIVVVGADTVGWRATGTHMNLPDVECGIWVGVRPPDGMHGAREGEPACWKPK